MNDCIFCKIIKGEIQGHKVFENDNIVIIKDIHPKSKEHYLLMPKEHYLNLTELTPARAAVLAEGLLKVKELAPVLGLSGGYRLVTNAGRDAFQTVMHLHVHILGGEMLSEFFGREFI